MTPANRRSTLKIAHPPERHQADANRSQGDHLQDVEEEDTHIGIFRIDPEETRRHIARLEKVRADRDDERVATALRNLEAIARGTGNTVPAILECVEAYSTTGDICDVFREVFGTYDPATAL